MSVASEGGASGPAQAVAWEVRRFDVIDSTNRHLLDEARRGAAEGLVAVADFQESGRGRLDRRWEAPPGSSLLVSVLLRPSLQPGEIHLVVTVASLAASDACFTVTGVRPAVKWPNDLVAAGESGELAGRKLAGVLAEADWTGEAPAVVVGVGINVNWPDGACPIPELGARAVALNQLCGNQVDRDRLLDAFLDGLGSRYTSLADTLGKGSVMREYRARCDTLGRYVEVETAGETITGTAVDVDDDGRLLVSSDVCIKTIVAGDLVSVRAVGP